MTRKKTSNALELIDRMAEGDPDYKRMVEEEYLNVRVAETIYRARTAAKLTRKDLAKLVGTSQSVISRLENADYGRHSLTMLRRIAAALDRRVEIRLVTLKSGRHRSHAVRGASRQKANG